MMRVLKKKFKKKNKSITILPKIKTKRKIGRWCEYYAGRLPYPMECSNNKSMPISKLFKGKKIIVLKDRSNCVECKRNIEWPSWKRGDWGKIIEAIEKGENLTDMDPPNQEMR